MRILLCVTLLLGGTLRFGVVPSGAAVADATTGHRPTAIQPDPQPAARPPRHVVPPPPDPQRLRQGGDTIADAVPLPTLNHTTTGTTTGYTDDHDEACPYTGSTSPDVVYTFTPGMSTTVAIDMYHSQYDTKIYVYDQDLALVACNDDYYDDFTSYLGSVPVAAGVTYFLVIDGYGGQAGDYQMSIRDHGSADVVECNAWSVLEGEPPLVDGYVDLHNGGCNSLGDADPPPFQPIASEWFCGQAGWYLVDGQDHRDTDWFTLTMPAAGALEIIGSATFATSMYELGPPDCDQVTVQQAVTIAPFGQNSLVITGEPGSTVWFWVGAESFTPPVWADPPYEYTYLLHIPQVVVTEQHTLSAVKSLYR